MNTSVKLWEFPCSCGTDETAGSLQEKPAVMHTSLQGKGWLESWVLDSINCIGLGEKDPWHCSGQLVAAGEKGAGVGV